MELEELKQAWTAYDKKLTDNLKTNKELLKKMNLDRAKSAMDIPKRYEMFSVVITFAAFIFVLVSTMQVLREVKFIISGMLTSIWFVAALVLTVRKLMSLMNLNFYEGSILDIQKQLSNVRKKYLQYKKFELYSFPFFVIVSIPIAVEAIHGFDIFELPVSYAIGVGLALIIGYPLAIWVYRNFYDRKLKDTDHFLSELSSFETGEQ